MRAPRGGFDVATVRAAQRGDQTALRDLLAEALPLVYNIVGFALHAHADVDDAVQETMVRAVRGLRDVRDPGAFRSWLVAVAIRQIHDHQRASRAVQDRTMPLDEAFAVADPAADFADVTALRLDLTGQRREVAEAATWLDDGNRELLGLWWMTEQGRLDRAELAEALGVPQNQAAVRIQRLKQQLSATRVVVRALRAPERCRGLSDLTSRWDGHRNALWRKRFVGHTRDCEICDGRSHDLVPVEKLLAGLPLAVVPTALAAAVFKAATAASAGGGGGAAGIAHGSHGASSLGHGSSLGHSSAKLLGFLPAKVPAVIAAVAAASAVGVAATAVWANSQTSGALPAPTPIASSTSTSSPNAVAAASPPPTSTTPPTTPSPKPSTPVPSSKPTSPSAHPTPTKTVAPPPRPGVSGPKKGVAAWSAPGFDSALTSSKASWYYDWSPSRMDQLGKAGPEFVPMIWGAKNADSTTLATARSAGTTLLGFNEPDMGSQSNMTVAQALDLWPKLQATGLRLGSPAVAANAATPGGWLDQFMAGAAARGYRVDFITVHWYGSDFRPGPAVDQLRSYLQAIHDRYHLPIWVTEYALISFSGGSQYPAPDQQAAFVTQSAAMLDSLPYVERYAWFGLAASSGSSTGTALFQNGAATPMGVAYEAS
ncbi:RNA polymerase, sigma-24 subunit, ECF subfamily [Catenulispora acidiphila DSM 44928]|uniref:RNA polymerase, sigma-24 subunit, ECF subfamily n=1 Tax=Catenulispora acidiphila (strain DSM 44928 / JCM 14897 / NBRC 102108 / NRRL B-24433 / ID139908) TaxID=479433 RepID=C7PXJ3_CATAD|nr:sigma-70 family RNA polymerase sigma factor [Catenulispora acidiphila]ACU71446.1 RNA polymerase, sigma-24 subunit, ECF subfamily [Catenulispora acidiphila DSM 44928]